MTLSLVERLAVFGMGLAFCICVAVGNPTALSKFLNKSKKGKKSKKKKKEGEKEEEEGTESEESV